MYNIIDDIIIICSISRDGRLKPGDEILMVDGKSLVGLTHIQAVGVLKMTQQLVQLVVATKVCERETRGGRGRGRGLQCS